MTLPRAYLIILSAFVWLIAWCFLGGLVGGPRDPYHLQDIIFPIAIGGMVIGILVGFAVWAGAKGHSPLLGALLGWLGPLGMLILVFMEDKSQTGRDLQSSPAVEDQGEPNE